MKFVCARTDLLKAVSAVKKAVSNNTNLQAVRDSERMQLKNDTLRISGGDQDVLLETTIKVDGQKDGKAVFPATLLLNIVKALGGEEIKVDTSSSDSAEIESADTKMSVRLRSDDYWPEYPKIEGKASKVDATSLEEALRQVLSAAGTDDTRPILTGIFVEPHEDGNRFVATDSYRLAYRDLPSLNFVEDKQTALLPSKTLTHVSNFIRATGTENISFKMSDNVAQFEVGNAKIRSTLIDGKYPAYRGLLPSEDQPNKLTVDKSTLLDALNRVKVFAVESTPVQLLVEQKTSMELRSTQEDVGSAKEVIEVEYDGEPLTIGFNPQYLIDGISAIKSDSVIVDITDALKPVVLTPNDSDNTEGDFLYLLMPVRIG